jgi:hypothetical protein
MRELCKDFINQAISLEFFLGDFADRFLSSDGLREHRFECKVSEDIQSFVDIYVVIPEGQRKRDLPRMVLDDGLPTITEARFRKALKRYLAKYPDS